jgi:hypothetical protein
MKKKIKFLIVDDEDDIREIICLIVAEYFEAEFIEAASCNEAKKFFNSTKL